MLVLTMSQSRQATFGKITVNEYNGEFGGKRGCDECVGTGDNGLPVKCSNNASYVILRHKTGIAEFYCKTHAKDTWIEMANE